MPGIQFTFEVNDAVSGAIEGIKGKIESAFDNQETLATFNAGLSKLAQRGGEMGDIAKQVFQDGWGDSLGDVTGAISSVGDQLLDLSSASPDEIKKITTSAMDLAKVMGVDVTEVTRAAGQMMKNGLAPDAMSAFDTITVGARVGGNAAGDLLDTFTEYGPSFNAIGVDGPTALFMMKNALDAGILSSDKAADAINEFGVRAIDGSKASGEAYTALGLNAEEMAQKIAGGGPAAAEATSQIIEALGSMTDPVAQEAAGVALFGSMWEDSGAKAILALDPANAETESLAGNTEEMGKVLNDTAKNKVETMKRKFDGWVDSLVESDGPLGDVMTWAQSFGPEVLAVGSQVGIAAMAISNMGIASKIAAGFQWLLNAAMSANPIMLIVVAIGALVAAFLWLWDQSEEFRQFWIGLWTNVEEIVRDAAHWLMTQWFILVECFDKIFSWIEYIWSAIWGAVRDFFVGIADWLQRTWADMVSFFVRIWNELHDRVTAIFTSIRDWIGERIADIKQFATDVRDWFVARWRDIYTAFFTVWDAITRTITSVATTIGTIVSTVFGWVRDRINDMVTFITGIPERIKSSIQAIKDAIATGSGFSLQVRPGMSILTGSFPKLADGGIVMPRSGGTNVTVGEAGEAEAVIPLSKLGQMSGGGGRGPEVHIHIPVGFVGSKDELAAAVRDVLAYGNRTGVIPA